MKLRLPALLLLLVITASCATAPPHVQATKAFQATAVSVDTGMKIAGDLYRQGVIDDRDKAQILTAYSHYQQAARITWAGLKAWNEKADGKPVNLDDVQVAARALLDLVESFRKRGP